VRTRELIIRKHPEVYDPSEDTMLLINNLVVKENEIVLEIGVGSGYVSLVAAENAESVVGIDINPHAVKLAKLNAKLNNISNVEFILGDLFSPINGRFSLILINPPYLQRLEGLKHRQIDYSWNGGEDGRMLTERFLREANNYLEKTGRMLIVQSSLSGYEETMETLLRNGLKAKTIAEETLFFETLYLIETTRE
jgi:release factor glutamine methyltransferase